MTVYQVDIKYDHCFLLFLFVCCLFLFFQKETEIQKIWTEKKRGKTGSTDILAKAERNWHVGPELDSRWGSSLRITPGPIQSIIIFPMQLSVCIDVCHPETAFSPHECLHSTCLSSGYRLGALWEWTYLV